MWLTALCWFALTQGTAVTGVRSIDYEALWNAAIPFDRFLQSVRAREDQWRSRFANAAIDADALTRARALRFRRHILVVTEDRCRDSAWTVPYIAKLVAAAPKRLELRVIGTAQGAEVQDAHPTPDGRRVTPTVVILDESNNAIGAWVDRPSDLRAWVAKNKSVLSSAALDEYLNKWYGEDAGKSTLREILPLLEARPGVVQPFRAARRSPALQGCFQSHVTCTASF